ncbi:MAG TPA: AMP-binding protein, partial [Ktedonobacteraceae bacterium]|nr:AMP-binding protein [Ktedonobacteraceae bacterium]
VPQPEHLYAPFPLTDIQQAYWVGRNTSFEMGNIATHNYSEFIFSDLDLKRFQHALQRLIQRHAMLRAVIRSDGTQQFLSDVPPYIVQFYDLRQAREEEIEQHLQQIRSHLSHQVFPLDHWPFFEVQVSQVASTRFLVHISIDALICDAWSRQIIGQELLLFYTDADLQLPPLTLSFRDYVIAERALQETERYHRAKSYWMERLNELPPAPELPLLLNPRQIQTPHFVRLSGGLSAERWRNLQKRALALQITPSALISAAYLEILTCWSKTKRLTINLTLFHRMPLHPQVNQIVGDFTSLLLLSSEGGAPTFAERAKAIHAQMLEALDQSLFSGIEVLRELNRRRGAETGAIMPVVLTSTLGSSPGSSAQALDTWYEGNEYGISQTPQVYIDHAVSEQRGELVFRWDAVQEIFPEHMIADMFAAYQQLLQNLADDEEYWSLSTRNHLVPTEHHAVQKAANATQESFAPGLLHQGFLQQACSHPEALAIFTAERQITYRELDLYSATLAHTLYKQGARPDQLIAVCMEKGWEQIVAVLAILRAGAAYVPIDPALPPARRQQLFEQAEVTCILTQPWLDKALEWPEHCQRLIVEDNDPPNALPDPWSVETTPAHLAYVIYTSGSTGMPKGVMIDHQSALNTIEDMNQRFVVRSADRVLALSALNFDLSVYDVFGLLAAGGCLVMPAARAERDPAQW